jgi:hypothetical protein
MIIRYILFLLCFGISLDTDAQLSENFGDGDIQNNPAWSGTTNHFRVNANGQLQLNAPAAGESYIFTKYKMPSDSITVDLYFRMNFEPSDNNYTKIYLFTDDIDENKANGYYLRLGENGSNDAVKLVRITNGVSTVIATGSLGAISKDPAQGRIQIKIDSEGIWDIAVDYAGGFLYTSDIEFKENLVPLPDSVFFWDLVQIYFNTSDSFLL